MKDKVQAELKKNFRPEFLNRIDATVVFRSLTVDEIRQIVDLMLRRVSRPAQGPGHDPRGHPGRQGPSHRAGLGSSFGARPLRRVIQNQIEDVLAEHLLLNRYEAGATIVVDKVADDTGLRIGAVEAKTPVEVS